MIYWVPLTFPGRLALSARPRTPSDLEGVFHVLSLLDEQEWRELELSWLESRRLPIPDRGLPSKMGEVEKLSHWACDLLRQGQDVLVHCRAGIGRTGLMAACILGDLNCPISGPGHKFHHQIGGDPSRLDCVAARRRMSRYDSSRLLASRAPRPQFMCAIAPVTTGPHLADVGGRSRGARSRYA